MLSLSIHYKVPMLFDSHAHLASDELYPHVDEILERAQKQGVKSIINICTDLKTLERGLKIAQKYPWVFNAGCTTPHDVEKEGETYFKAFEKAALEGQLVAVGETGLDYYYEHSKKELQQEFFIRYMDLAKRAKLPLIIHCRDAFEDFFKLIDKHYPLEKKGVLHCFTGNLEDAKKLIERQWYISFSGIITFKKSETLRKVVEITPIEQMFIETDAPYLAPQSRRGKVNEPAYVLETAQSVAQIKKMSLQEIQKQTFENAARFFKLRK